MSKLDEQLIALGAVFEAATLVDRIARTGQVPNAALGCMLGSLLARNPQTTLEIYGGDDLNLRDGYRALVGALERDSSSLQREPLRYALAMIGLERQLRQTWRHAASHRQPAGSDPAAGRALRPHP